MKLNPETLAKALYVMTADLPRNKQEGVIRDFSIWLKRKGKLHWGQRIAKALTRYGEQQEQKKRVQITVAHAPSTRVANELTQKLKSAGDEVQITVNPEIIGGAVIQKGFTIIDASVKGKLDRLRS